MTKKRSDFRLDFVSQHVTTRSPPKIKQRLEKPRKAPPNDPRETPRAPRMWIIAAKKLWSWIATAKTTKRPTYRTSGRCASLRLSDASLRHQIVRSSKLAYSVALAVESLPIAWQVSACARGFASYQHKRSP